MMPENALITKKYGLAVYDEELGGWIIITQKELNQHFISFGPSIGIHNLSRVLKIKEGA